MITKIVFDLGRVLLTYDPRTYLESLYGHTEKAERLLKAVFFSPNWIDLDRGVITEEDAFMKMLKDAPYPEDIRYLLYHWDEMLHPVEPVVQIARRLKEQGYSLFILSNFHRRAYEQAYQKYPFFKLFDGILISAYTGLVKPDPAIYKRLADEFSISPEKCLFIDDMPVNVHAAELLGMKGIVFHDPAQLDSAIADMDIVTVQR